MEKKSNNPFVMRYRLSLHPVKSAYKSRRNICNAEVNQDEIEPQPVAAIRSNTFPGLCVHFSEQKLVRQSFVCKLVSSPKRLTMFREMDRPLCWILKWHRINQTL